MRTIPAPACLTISLLLSALSGCGSSSRSLPEPCTFLTQTIAARISGDVAVTNQGTNVTEPASGFVACIFADTKNEANNISVQIKRVTLGANQSTLQAAARFFSRGEPVAPFQQFGAVGIGDEALGESTPGVAFIVFSRRDVLVYVGAGSASLSDTALRGGVENLAKLVAAGL